MPSQIFLEGGKFFRSEFKYTIKNNMMDIFLFISTQEFKLASLHTIILSNKWATNVTENYISVLGQAYTFLFFSFLTLYCIEECEIFFN